MERWLPMRLVWRSTSGTNLFGAQGHHPQHKGLQEGLGLNEGLSHGTGELETWLIFGAQVKFKQKKPRSRIKDIGTLLMILYPTQR